MREGEDAVREVQRIIQEAAGLSVAPIRESYIHRKWREVSSLIIPNQRWSTLILASAALPTVISGSPRVIESLLAATVVYGFWANNISPLAD